MVDASGPWKAHDSARSFLFVLFDLTAMSLLTLSAFIAQARYPLRYYMFPLNLLRRFGRAGFSFYMLHGPIPKIFALLMFPRLALAGASPSAYWVIMPFCFLLAAIASALMFLPVERPIQMSVNRTLPVSGVHADPRTTRLYGRRDKKITRNIVERISI